MAELMPDIFETSLTTMPDKSQPEEWTPPLPESAEFHLSIASAASLACGIFLIVPFFAGLVAVTLGIIGIRQINESNLKMRGRRLAIAGMLLGLLNIVGWAAYFKFISEISGPGRMVAHHFIDDLNSANPAGAERECAGSIDPARLESAANQLKNWGGVKNSMVLYITRETNNGILTGSVRGMLRTPAGEHAFQLQIVSEDNSNWKIRDFSLQ